MPGIVVGDGDNDQLIGHDPSPYINNRLVSANSFAFDLYPLDLC